MREVGKKRFHARVGDTEPEDRDYKKPRLGGSSRSSEEEERLRKGDVMNTPKTIHHVTLLVGVSLTKECFVLDSSSEHREEIAEECYAVGCLLRDWNLSCDSQAIPNEPGVYKLQADIQLYPEHGELGSVIGWDVSFKITAVKQIPV